MVERDCGLVLDKCRYLSSIKRILAILYLLCALLYPSLALADNSNGSVVGLAQAYGKLPLHFEPNVGQAPGGVRYLARTPGATILLMDTEAVIQVRAKEAVGSEASAKGREVKAAVVRMRLAGASRPRKVEKLDRLPGTSNYFLGANPRRWQKDIPQYRRLRYETVYSGVDVVYSGTGQQFRFDFELAAGSDPSKVALQFEGMDRLRIAESGELLLETAVGEVRLAQPVVYQEGKQGRETIEAGFRLLAEGRVGFAIGEYDRSQPLVIDPTLTYSTYLGSSGSEYGLGVAVDAARNAYIVGYTSGTEFPVINPIQNGLVNRSDVFVSKLNSTGTQLIWSTYLGGGGEDFGRGIAVDSSGNTYITGYTGSADFPIANAAQGAIGGPTNATLPYDAFVAKLSSSGNSLVYSTFLGGQRDDYGYGIAADVSSGDAYVTGCTSSWDFPLQGAYQPVFGGANNGSSDAFVAKFSAAGTRRFSTYLGGSRSDCGRSIALDGSGNSSVAGYTESDDFPTTSGVIQTGRHGSYDAFVARMASDGSSLAYSTYLGGSGEDGAYGVAVDSSGSAHVTGYTYSSDFPTTPDVVQPSLHGLMNGFLTKLGPGAATLGFSTYLGERSKERAPGAPWIWVCPLRLQPPSPLTQTHPPTCWPCPIPESIAPQMAARIGATL